MRRMNFIDDLYRFVSRKKVIFLNFSLTFQGSRGRDSNVLSVLGTEPLNKGLAVHCRCFFFQFYQFAKFMRLISIKILITIPSLIGR